MENNPQVKAAYDQIQANGGDGRAAFLTAARGRGLTDEQIQNGLNELKQMFKV
jgi:hypothetical protein